MQANEIKVLSEKEIMQKMAGYKSNYTKRVKAAKTDEERRSLENGREAYMTERLNELNRQNRKQRQRRAGVLSWVTRRENCAKRHVSSTETKQTKKPVAKTANRKFHGSTVGIRIITK